MGNKNRTQKKVIYKGNTFICALKGGKVTVRIQRTARGQVLLAGVFDVQNRMWQNENHSAPLPSFVKKEVEATFV